MHYFIYLLCLLLGQGADLESGHLEGFTSVIAAASNGYIEVVTLLTQRGAKAEALPMSSRETLSLDVFGESSQQLSIQESEFLETGSAELYELISASIEGRLSRVSQMLNQGMDVNQRDEAGRTALMEASAFGRFGVVVRLINAGADINLRDNQGITSLMLATLEGRERVVKLLID